MCEVWVTNFIEYAPEGYEVQAFRYILKRDIQQLLPNYLSQASERLKKSKQTFKIQIAGEIIDLKIDQIVYAEVCQHDTTIYVTVNQRLKAYCVHYPLSELENKLEVYGFLRIHKSYLVNMKCI